MFLEGTDDIVHAKNDAASVHAILFDVTFLAFWNGRHFSGVAHRIRTSHLCLSKSRHGDKTDPREQLPQMCDRNLHAPFLTCVADEPSLGQEVGGHQSGWHGSGSSSRHPGPQRAPSAQWIYRATLI